jgi:excisionase family DNA binding protein
MPTLEPLALSPRDAAALLSISKRSLSRLIAARKIAARKDGSRTLVDVGFIPPLSCPAQAGHPVISVGAGGSRWTDERAVHPHDRWLLGRPPEAGDDGSECGAVGPQHRHTIEFSESLF